MNRRIETRVVIQATEGNLVLINKDASEVYWITVNAGTLGTMGLCRIYDGFDTTGKLKWEMHPGYDRNYNFIPPIPCDQGVFVEIDAATLCYTIAWRPKKWDRPRTPPEDVITAPEP